MTHPGIRIVTSPANEEIKAIRALERRKERKETGLFVADGLRHVLEGIETRWELLKLVYAARVAGKPDVEKARRACLHNGGICLEVSDAVLEKISHKDNPQQVIGVFRQRFAPLAELPRKRCIVALEQVRDPGNLGTIIRTVDGAGADGIILIGQCCDPFSPEAVRASMGSVFAVPVSQCSRQDFIAFAKSWKGTAIGTHLSADTVDYRTPDYMRPVLLVMGNEQAGLSDELSAALPILAKLPMSGRADSLNLAVATGIMIYAALEGGPFNPLRDQPMTSGTA